MYANVIYNCLKFQNTRQIFINQSLVIGPQCINIWNHLTLRVKIVTAVNE